MHYHFAWGQREMEILERTATLFVSYGHWNFCNALPHCLGALGSGTLVMHYHAPGGNAQWKSCNALPQCLGIIGSETHVMHATLPEGNGPWNACNSLPQCLGASGSGTLVIHCCIVRGQYAGELLQWSATLPMGSGH